MSIIWLHLLIEKSKLWLVISTKISPAQNSFILMSTACLLTYLPTLLNTVRIFFPFVLHGIRANLIYDIDHDMLQGLVWLIGDVVASAGTEGRYHVCRCRHHVQEEISMYFGMHFILRKLWTYCWQGTASVATLMLHSQWTYNSLLMLKFELN